MKVRIIKKPGFTSLHHVQVKRWWLPFWKTVAYDDVVRCHEIADSLVKTKHAYTVVMQGESK